MRKLELKEGKGYLGTGVKAQDVDTKELRDVTLLHFTYTRETVGINHLLYEGLLLKKHMLVLHPLSDLTKYCDDLGFVPIDILRSYYSGFYFESNPEILIKSKNTNMYISIKWTQEIQEKLYKWKFDIHNLIPDNLAIDINTIKL